MNILDMKRKLLPMGGYMGGMDGGGGGAAPQTSTSYNTNIPEYARPYVEQMLGSAQEEIFNYSEQPEYSKGIFGGTGRRIGTKRVPTSIKGYTPFSDDPSSYFAEASPMQQQSYQQAAGLTTAPQLAGATGMAAEAGLRGLDTRYGPGQFSGNTFDQGAAQYYMNPYMQSVVDMQQQEAQRQADIAGTQRGAQAVQAGAFGGSRQAIMDAEAARNLASQKGAIQSQGLNTAFSQAQQQFNQDMARRQAAEQMYEQSRQYGAGLGMQGLQTALQGAGALGQLGQTQYGQQVGNIELQNRLGGQQQQQQQAILNQQIQDYATKQQYPMMQLANMSNLLRGMPMQSATTQTYQAQPSGLSQIAGLGATALGAYGASGGFKGAAGGSVKDIQNRPAGLAELALSKMT
jgi:hypothetical protein